jgi:hypothetical protein
MTSAFRFCVSLVLAFVITASGCIQIERTPAYVRMLNVSPDYLALDLYMDDELLLQSVEFETISGYSKVDSDEYTLEFTKSGVSNTLESRDEDLDADSHKTLIAFGNTGAFSSLLIDEDAEQPDSGEARLSIVNVAMDAESLDVYLTDASASLDDVAPTFSDVATGSIADTSPLVIDSGTYRLRIVGAGSKSAVRFDSQSLVLASRSITTIVVTGTTGGVLVNAAVLPQQGELILLRNEKARVRTAIGIASAASVTVRAGDTTVVSSAPYATLSKFQLVPAGSTTFEVLVGGSLALSTSTTLESGADYTLLLLDTGSGTSSSFLVDDNRLPTSGQVKLRLVNAMTGLAAPITVATNYDPLIENLAVGGASEYAEMDAAPDARIDVTDASTARALYYQTGIDFASDSVFTLVMFGSSSATTGVLRQER